MIDRLPTGASAPSLAPLLLALGLAATACDTEPEPPLDVVVGVDMVAVSDTSADAPEDAAPEPTCDDGVQNGDEEDVDCGGSSCDACPIPCVSRLECTGLQYCNSEGFCTDPTCDDGVRSGLEPDVDCGEPCPNRCPDGANCFEDSDCVGLKICDSTCSEPPPP